MKHVTISLLRNILGVSVLAASVALSSCETIYDDLAPCRTEYRMKFLYNRNMKFADAFPAEVDHVTLNVIDSEGRIIHTHTESGEALKTEGYEIVLDDLRDYRFYASDLKHPSPMAVDYIYEFFSDYYFSSKTRQAAAEGRKLTLAARHRSIL